MGVYLGNVGKIEIKRESIEGFKESVVNPSDVNDTKNRFSFDFEEGVIITGDLVELTTTDGTDLDFVDATGWANSTVQPSGNWYVFVDELGGIKLYNTFDESLDGETTGQIPLNAIARNIPIKVSIRDRDSRILACVNEYELNTNRETADTTGLSEEHRNRVSTIISGSGRLNAEWDYVKGPGEEPVNYLMQLVLRTEIGSAFRAKLYIKSPNTRAVGGDFNTNQLNDALWWEFDAIVTDSATQFDSGRIIASTINFVTTGPIKLRAQTQAVARLLQEDGVSRVALEQDDTSFVLLEQSD
jgi:hypothetical protein